MTPPEAPSPVPHVVVVGGGFGGLAAVKALRRVPVRITLIDRRNFHLFQPLLYEVATATLSPADITEPLRTLVKSRGNCRVLMGEVTRVDVEEQRIILRAEQISYDYLVLATGFRNHYRGNDAWAPLAPGLKTIEDSLEIRARFLRAFEQAEWELDESRRREMLTFIVVGAGSTGMELAGALSETVRRVMNHDFRTVRPEEARIILVEMSAQVLPGLPPNLAERARKQIEDLGVEVRTEARLTELNGDGAAIDGKRFPRATVFWAAGVRGTRVAEDLGAPLDRAGRVVVDPDCTVPGRREVFVIGDLARFEQDGRVVTGVAPAAIQMARHAARCIRRDLDGKSRKPFEYFDKGMAATIGRSAAVARAGRVQVSGFPAWVVWVVLHLIYLVGFRNRVSVAVQWFTAWVLGKKGVRLIGEPWVPATDGSEEIT
jgi:NADH:ubiquinone reductase (H+-translocating)